MQIKRATRDFSTLRMKPGVSTIVKFGQNAYLQVGPQRSLHFALTELDTCMATKKEAHSARITIGFAETVAPEALRCASVMALIASATALAGSMGGLYSSDSSSCRRQRGS